MLLNSMRLQKKHCPVGYCVAKDVLACKRMCKNADQRISPCTHFLARPYHAYTTAIVCALFNGPMRYRKYNDGDVIVGEALCNEEKKEVQEKSTAKWVKLQTCDASRAPGPLECTYSKMVGVAYTEASKQANTDSASLQMGLKYGMEAEASAIFATAKASMELSMGAGTSYSWTQESSETFGKTAEETQTATYTVQKGQIASICQPMGSINEFTIYSSHFSLVNGTQC